MPYRCQWYIEKRVILEEAYGDLTVEELVRFNAEVTTMIIEKGTPPVHVIADLSKVGKYPSLREMLSAMRQKAPEKMGWMLVVTDNKIIRFLASMIFQIARLRLRMFATMPEATKFLAENDDSLALH